MSTFVRISSLAGVTCLLFNPAGFAFERSDDCNSCHGDFRGGTSPQGTVFPSNDKHRMHNNSSYMNTDCFLCHTEEEDTPLVGSSAGTANNPGLGCSGCHVGAGLRAHHAANGVPTCYTVGCHDPEPSPPENVKPPYYGTVDTKVDNPCNDAQVSNTNENWSIGDFVGLDNDGNDLYDLADFACGPPYRISDIAVEGDDVRITWDTVGGRTDLLRAATGLDAMYAGVDTPITIPGVGLVTTNRVELGGATNGATRGYQITYSP